MNTQDSIAFGTGGVNKSCAVSASDRIMGKCVWMSICVIQFFPAAVYNSTL